MALLQISEPGQSTAPHQHRLAAGIDLGTTHSLIATVRSGEAAPLADEQGRFLLPSVVHYGTDSVAVGHDAMAEAASDPDNTISSVKRLMGRGIDEVSRLDGQAANQIELMDNGLPAIKTRDGYKNPVSISAEILKVLAARAEQALGDHLTGVVITVPAYFDDAQRQATKDSASLARLNVLRLISEPTAAALAYGLDSGEEGLIAVYDLGGGTFDISLLNLQRGLFEVIATGGDSALGGDDMDMAIANWILGEAGFDIDSRGAHQALLRAARKAKEALTETSAVTIEFSHEQLAWHGELSVATFNELIEPLLKKSLRACRRTLKDAGLKASDIKEIVMVGGSTRVPAVRTAVEAFFGKRPLTSIDPDKVVAIGAALQADLLVGNKPGDDTLLLDVTPLSLGIETMGGLTEKIIPRNSTIPVARAQEFTTYQDGQSAMAIHVVQGERELVEDCRSLARFELRGIPAMVAGAARIKVTFEVDADGLLNVSAKETTTGVEASVQVKPSYGLEESEIAAMLKASIDTADSDMQARMLREEQVEAKRVIEAVTAALGDNGAELLSREERATIERKITELQQATESGSLNDIKKAISLLDNATAEFASRRMDASIAKALVGKDVEQL